MVWTALAVSPLSVAAWFASTHAGDWAPIVAPLGAAAPFAALAVYVIRRQEQQVDALSSELARVNSETIDKFVLAINDATSLHRESTRMWEQVLTELRRRP